MAHLETAVEAPGNPEGEPRTDVVERDFDKYPRVLSQYEIELQPEGLFTFPSINLGSSL